MAAVDVGDVKGEDGRGSASQGEARSQQSERRQQKRAHFCELQGRDDTRSAGVSDTSGGQAHYGSDSR